MPFGLGQARNGTVDITGAQLSTPLISHWARKANVGEFRRGIAGAQSHDDRNSMDLKGSTADG
jgi:hypothetical protein